ncbi:Alpha/beta hydrolase family-domain-containing protein [Hypoxylon sp. FL1150]|nr:Alpha/beta hydrolase family-domain-containing protein [Hypoxylon sp. FL1150]
MVRVTSSALLAALAAGATARNCKNLTVPISITASNTQFTLEAPSDNVEVTNFALNLARPGANYTAEVLGADQFADVSGNYTIGATYCTPDSGPGSALQVLTHGIAFDRWYWDFPLQNRKYSYADAALARNYSVFFYDRLGLGESSRGEPVNEIQAAAEIQALRALTTMLRSGGGTASGSVPGIEDTYEKVVHVGHSFGSIQSYALTAAYPELSDGVALTGFSLALGDYVPDFLLGANFVEARGASPALAAYPEGYLASGDKSAVQTNFFAPGDFDPAVLDAAYATGQPVTVGELMTIGTAASGRNSYGGPVLVITGDRDIPFCGGNCSTSEPSIPAQVSEYFTNASSFEAVVVCGAGHGLNLVFYSPNVL